MLNLYNDKTISQSSFIRQISSIAVLSPRVVSSRVEHQHSWHSRARVPSARALVHLVPVVVFRVEKCAAVLLSYSWLRTGPPGQSVINAHLTLPSGTVPNFLRVYC